MGLSQMVARDAVTVEPSLAVLKHVKNLALFAQKAEITRKILERYLLGTEISRIDPVYIPSASKAYSSYTFPAQDPSVMKAEHMPRDLNSWPRPYPSMGWGTTAPASTPAMYRADIGVEMLGSTLSLPSPCRSKLIKDFI